jgi:hypothetical protein
MYHKTWYRVLLMLVTLVHLSCVIFEPPSSINLKSPKFNSPGGFTNVTFGRSHVIHNEEFFLGDYTYFTMPFITIVEALCIGLHWGDIFVQYKLSGGTCRVALDYSWYKIKVIVISLMTINSLVSIVLVFGVHEQPFNFIRMLRPLLLIEQLENVRKLLKSVINSFAKIRGVLSALFFITAFFAVVATALFRGITGMPPENIVTNKLFVQPETTLKPSSCKFLSRSDPMGQDGIFCSSFSKNCLDYWKTIPHSWMHLFTVLTTANYPDVMMPVVECNEMSFIFFAVFIFLGLFFFLNLVLAIVTNSFSGDTTRDMKSYQDKKLFMLADSFAKIVLCTEKNDNTSQNHYTGIINRTGGSESESGTLPSQNGGGVEKEQEEKSKSEMKKHKEVDRLERLTKVKSKSLQNVLQPKPSNKNATPLKSSAASSSRNSTVSNRSNHNYNDSKSSFAQMASGGSTKNARNSLALPSSMDNVGWGWSRVKVRRGQQDPISLVDYNNINLSCYHIAPFVFSVQPIDNRL